MNVLETQNSAMETLQQECLKKLEDAKHKQHFASLLPDCLQELEFDWVCGESLPRWGLEGSFFGCFKADNLSHAIGVIEKLDLSPIYWDYQMHWLHADGAVADFTQPDGYLKRTVYHPRPQDQLLQYPYFLSVNGHGGRTKNVLYCSIALPDFGVSNLHIELKTNAAFIHTVSSWRDARYRVPSRGAITYRHTLHVQDPVAARFTRRNNYSDDGEHSGWWNLYA